MAERAGKLFTTAYLLLIFGIYPFYMEKGYVDVGNAKYRFFIYSSLAALIILALIGAACGVRAACRRLKRHEPYLVDFSKLSLTDMLVILYAAIIFVSYAYSDYKEDALWGTDGWHMGLALLLALCGLYFVVSRFWDGKGAVWYAGLAASGAVFLLGILDRFSIYLIPLKIREPAFISTLGNINWFCGYLSILAPVGVCMFLFGKRRQSGEKAKGFYGKFERWVYGIYVVTAFTAGFCQGGNSVFLFWGALFYMLLWIAVKKEVWLRDYFLLLFLWGLSAQAVRTMLFIFPEGYNYERDNFCIYLVSSNIMLFVGGAALGGYIYLRSRIRSGKKELINDKTQSLIHRIMAAGLSGCVLLWLILAVLNTWIGISGLGQSEGFLLDENWGHGRGAAIYSSVRMYRQMPFFHKLVGIGPDCFSAYAYSLPEVAVGLRNNFGADRLTNAHNELLTCLVNTGILGLFLYLCIFIYFVKRCMKLGQENPHFYLYAVCAVCYFTHNMVSFAQVLNYPFLFLMLGMGEKDSRMDKGRGHNEEKGAAK